MPLFDARVEGGLMLRSNYNWEEHFKQVFYEELEARQNRKIRKAKEFKDIQESYAVIISETAKLKFSRNIHLDHFHWRPNPALSYYCHPNCVYHVKTYKNGIIVN